jgi:hypothetical protein
MAEEKLNYTAQFVNQIKAQIAALQTVLASVESASAVGALQPLEGISISPTGPVRGESLGIPTDLPEGAFNNKSVPACIELYLSSAPMKKKTNKEIAAALHEGGVESNASKFDTVIAGALFKLKKDGKILRFKDGWGLSEWYPAHIRGAADAGPSKRPKKKTKRDERKNRSAKSKASAAPVIATESTKPKGKAADQIVELLRSKPEHEYPLEEVAKHTGLGVKFARLTLGKLMKAGRVRMTAPATYLIGRPLLAAVGD